MLAVVLAGALVTYGGVSLFVAFFVLAPMATALFRAAGIPRRLMPAAIALGTSTFTMSALPGTPAIQNAIPMPFFGTTPFAAPGPRHHRLRHHAGLRPVVAGARRSRGAARGRRLRRAAPARPWMPRRTTRWCASAPRPPASFDPAEIHHGQPQPTRRRRSCWPLLPLVVVVGGQPADVAASCCRGIDAAFLAEPRWGATSLSAVGGVWSVAVALAGRASSCWSPPTGRGCRRCARAWMPAPTPPCCRR